MGAVRTPPAVVEAGRRRPHSQQPVLTDSPPQIPEKKRKICIGSTLGTSNADPDSGSISTWCGTGSVSFYHQAKIVRKGLIPTVLGLLYEFLALKIT
jgi:hypothetical protein